MAATIAHGSAFPLWTVQALNVVAQVLAAQGESERAGGALDLGRNAALQIHDPYERAVALAGLATNAGRLSDRAANLLRLAVAIGDSISSADDYDHARLVTAVCAASVGHLDLAVDVADRIDWDWRREEAWGLVAQTLFRSGQTTEGVRILRRIDSNQQRTLVILAAVNELLDNGDHQGARELAAVAGEAAHGEPVADPDPTSDLGYLTDLDDPEDRYPVWPDDPPYPDEHSTRRAERQPSSGDLITALGEGRLDQAARIVDGLQHPDRDLLRVGLIAAFARAGDDARAEALEQSLEDDDSISTARTARVGAAATTGDIALAARIADSIADPWHRTEALVKLAQHCDPPTARRYVAQALELSGWDLSITLAATLTPEVAAVCARTVADLAGLTIH